MNGRDETQNEKVMEKGEGKKKTNVGLKCIIKVTLLLHNLIKIYIEIVKNGRTEL